MAGPPISALRPTANRALRTLLAANSQTISGLVSWCGCVGSLSLGWEEALHTVRGTKRSASENDFAAMAAAASLLR